MSEPATSVRTEQKASWHWLIVFIAAALALQLELVFNRPVNWDEFFHLTDAHAVYQGRLNEPLQVLHARAFFWLAALPVDAVDQIRVARLFMFAFEVATLIAIYGIARHFAGRFPAALATLAYLTGGYVFQHGFSYRADPMAAAFLMGSLWMLLKSSLNARDIIITALLVALALLTTIKVVLYAPAFAALAWLRWREADDPRGMLRRLGLLLIVATVGSALVVGATVLSVPESAQLAAGSATKVVATSGTMMFNEGLFPRWPYILGAIASAPFLAVLLLCVPVAIFRAGLTRHHRIVIAALMLPLVSLSFYRNSFPYFYVFILPPTMVGVAIVIRQILTRHPAKVLMTAFVATALISSLTTPREVLPVQKEVLAAVDEIFPKPVAYFDFPGMIANFPKANFFMTTWGVRKYWAGQEERFVDAMERETVPLLVVNQELLVRNQTGSELAWELDEADATALRYGFIPHWGPLWVAGRRFPASGGARDFPIYAPGVYTLEGASARIDGKRYMPGDVVELSRGIHRFQPDTLNETRLRWGKNLKKPVKPFSGEPMFKDF